MQPTLFLEQSGPAARRAQEARPEEWSSRASLLQEGANYSKSVRSSRRRGSGKRKSTWKFRHEIQRAKEPVLLATLREASALGQGASHAAAESAAATVGDADPVADAETGALFCPPGLFFGDSQDGWPPMPVLELREEPHVTEAPPRPPSPSVSGHEDKPGGAEGDETARRTWPILRHFSKTPRQPRQQSSGEEGKPSSGGKPAGFRRTVGRLFDGGAWRKAMNRTRAQLKTSADRIHTRVMCMFGRTFRLSRCQEKKVHVVYRGVATYSSKQLGKEPALDATTLWTADVSQDQLRIMYAAVQAAHATEWGQKRFWIQAITDLLTAHADRHDIDDPLRETVLEGAAALTCLQILNAEPEPECGGLERTALALLEELCLNCGGVQAFAQCGGPAVLARRLQFYDTKTRCEDVDCTKAVYRLVLATCAACYEVECSDMWAAQGTDQFPLRCLEGDCVDPVCLGLCLAVLRVLSARRPLRVDQAVQYGEVALAQLQRHPDKPFIVENALALLAFAQAQTPNATQLLRDTRGWELVVECCRTLRNDGHVLYQGLEVLKYACSGDRGLAKEIEAAGVSELVDSILPEERDVYVEQLLHTAIELKRLLTPFDFEANEVQTYLRAAAYDYLHTETMPKEQRQAKTQQEGVPPLQREAEEPTGQQEKEEQPAAMEQKPEMDPPKDIPETYVSEETAYMAGILASGPMVPALEESGVEGTTRSAATAAEERKGDCEDGTTEELPHCDYNYAGDVSTVQ